MNQSARKEPKKSKERPTFVSRLSGRLVASFRRSPMPVVVTLSLILGAATTSLFGFYAWQKFVVQERNHQMAKFAEQNARLAASNAANFIHGIESKLSFFSKSSSLVTSFTYGDAAGLLEQKSALKNSFPKALAIRLHAAGEAKLNLDANPPLRFAELEQIRRAERRQAVIPEALDSGGGGWRINVVVPVPDDERLPVAGTIMVTMPIDELYEQLQNGLEQLGKVSLYQEFDGSQRLMGTFGRGTLFKADRIAVPETPWHVEFVADASMLKQTEIDYPVIAMIGLVGALGCMVAFLLVGLAIGRSFKRKQELLAETHVKMGRDMTSQAERKAEFDVRKEHEALLGATAVELQEEEDPLDISEAFEESEADDAVDESKVPDHIFRSYDIRGLFETEIDNALAQKIGQALGTQAVELGEKALIVGRDARTHSPILTENLIRGILSTGCDVLNIGTVPTPVLYYAVETLETTSSAVMVTASHNPANYNGFKVVMKGQTRSEADIKAIRARILKQDFRRGIGKEHAEDVIDRYVDTIFSDVALAGDMDIVIDAGNGVTGKVAPRLFSELGCTVTPLFCDLDGSFPNHGPDPSDPDNLVDLINKVQETGAKLGVAFDGDGDRLAVVTPKGRIIWPDQLLMLFAKDILARNPGADVVFDVKSSRLLNTIVASNGGRPIMWKTGHALMKAKVKETGALLGGEYSGHIFIKDRWYGFDDGMYAAARLIEIVSLRDESLDVIYDELPQLKNTSEIRVPVSETVKFDVIERLKQEGDFGDAKLVLIDGIRAEFAYGWGLVRASNTSAHLTLRFEAETDEQLHNLKALFTREIRKIEPTIEFNWSA